MASKLAENPSTRGRGRLAHKSLKAVWSVCLVLSLAFATFACTLPEDVVVGTKPGPGATPVDLPCGLDPCICTDFSCAQECEAPEQRLCRFECAQTAECNARCQGGDCSSLCREDAQCELSCVGGGCVAECAPGADCLMDCPGGGCSMVCRETARCHIDCPGGDCLIDCLGPEKCTIAGCDGSCSVNCGAMPCGPPPPPP